MDINFTGITNLKIVKSKNPVTSYGLYPSVTGELKMGEKTANRYKLCFNLTGKDLDEFIMAMSKSQHGVNTGYFKGEPNKFELLLTKYDIEDDIAKTSFNVFRLNDENISLTRRPELKIYEYLAHFTKNLIKNFNLSDNQKRLVNLINKSIQDDAVEFIENM